MVAREATTDTAARRQEEKMKWFEGCETLSEIKKRYRDLAMENHPDHGGDVEIMKQITAAMEVILSDLITAGVDEFESERGYRPDVDAQMFAEILRKIMHWNITIEIIGFWIYAFESFEARDDLKELGFWFSKKHRAWVYSGSSKRRRPSHMTLDDIRNTHGSETIKRRQEEDQRTGITA